MKKKSRPSAETIQLSSNPVPSKPDSSQDEYTESPMKLALYLFGIPLGLILILLTVMKCIN